MNSLKEIRKSTGLKQYEAAEKLKVSKDYLCMLESGKRQPSIKLILRMAKLYALTPDRIFIAINGTICSSNVSQETA